jgi:hypothetical protein
MRTKKVKVIERKYLRLDGHRALGIARQFERRIFIDPAQTTFSYANTLIHELMHIHFPEIVETRINQAACKIARALWDKNYRRVMK